MKNTINNINLKDLYESLAKEYKLIGSNFVVANDKGILESFCYGKASLEDNIYTNEDTIYRIASISKTVGSIGLMMLVEKGLIDLDEDISKYLGYLVRNPHYPNDVITVRMITLQTSSIQDGYDDENPAYDDITKGYNGVNGRSIDVSLKDLLTNPNCPYYTPLTFGNYQPGSRWCYSNFGCGIMACIIEKVSGETYVEYMENHLFKPLGIDASFKASRIKNKDLIATMYSYRQNGLKNWSKEWFTNGGYTFYPLGDNFRGPAGGLFISMKNLAKIMRIFLNYGTVDGVKVLNRETIEQMYQMQWCGLPDDSYRAKGIQMKIQKDNELLPLRGHTGSAYGVRSFMFFNLEANIGGCFITNGIDSSNEDVNAKTVFKELQKGYVKKYADLNISKKAIFNKDSILIYSNSFKQRKIIAKDMYLLDNKFIKLVHLMDVLDIVPIFSEDKLTVSFTYNNQDYFIDNVIYYHNNLYIPFTKTLDLLDIKYLVEKDSVKIG